MFDPKRNLLDVLISHKTISVSRQMRHQWNTETFPYLALWYSVCFLSVAASFYPVGIPHCKLCSVEMNASIHTFRERRSIPHPASYPHADGRTTAVFC